MHITSISAIALLAAVSGAAAYYDDGLYTREAAAAAYEDDLSDYLFGR